jgi:hypothetical protein
MRFLLGLLIFGIVVSQTSSFADTVDSNQITLFQGGTPALASEVNANFAALIDSINDNADNIASIERIIGAGQEKHVSDTGNAALNGTNLLAALESIGATSDSNPWLITLDPAIYDVGSNSLILKPYGGLLGRLNTRITGNINSNSSGVVVMAERSYVAQLQVEHTGGGSSAIAISASGVTPIDNIVGGIMDSLVLAKNADTAIGIKLTNSSSLIISDSNIGAFDSSVAIPIDVSGGSGARLQDVTATSYGANGGTNCGARIRGGSQILSFTSRISGSLENVGSGTSCGVSVGDAGSIFLAIGSTLFGVTRTVEILNSGNAVFSGGIISGPTSCNGRCLCAAVIGDYYILDESCAQ